jgi:hypothetical protein
MSDQTKERAKIIPLIKSHLVKIRNSFLEKKIKWNYPLTKCGINKKERDTPVVVSLTTIAPRLRLVSLTLRTLLSQSFRPDKVILWLSEHNLKGEKTIFKDRLPEELTELKNHGLEIRFNKDVGSHGKLIYALKEFPNAIIVTSDDDVIYPKNWLERLYQSYTEHPEAIHSYRARLISFKNTDELESYFDWTTTLCPTEKSLLTFPLGVDGVLYPPGVFNNEVFNEEMFRKICPTADDVWFKAMSLLNNTQCKKICEKHKWFPLAPGSQIVSLLSENISQNDEQIKKVFNQYELLEKLKRNSS